MTQNQTTAIEPVPAKPYQAWSVESIFDLEPPDWWMNYVLPKGGSCLLYGPTNVGKSLVALDWAFRLALGWNWMDQYVAEPASVLYVYSEGGHDLQLRYQAWAEGNNVQQIAMMEDNLTFIGLDEEVNLRWDPDREEAPEGVRRLYATAELVNPDVIVFDPAQEVWRGMDGNSDRHVAMAWRVVKDLQRIHDASAIIVHHARKDGDTFRGATTWLDLADTGFSIQDGDVEGQVKLQNTKNRYAEKGHNWLLARKKQVLSDKVLKLLGMDSVYITKGYAKPETPEDHQKIIDALRLKGEMRANELAKLVGMTDSGGSMSRTLKKMQELGIIERSKQGNRLSPYRLVESGAQRPEDV